MHNQIITNNCQSIIAQKQLNRNHAIGLSNVKREKKVSLSLSKLAEFLVDMNKVCAGTFMVLAQVLIQLI